jgi:hypothetical protein
MIIRARRRVINAAKALRDGGVVPPGVDQPEVYRHRSGGVVLPRSADWLEATRALRQAFVPPPATAPGATPAPLVPPAARRDAAPAFTPGG